MENSGPQAMQQIRKQLKHPVTVRYDFSLFRCLITLVNTIFVTRNVECDSYVTFYAEFKNIIRIFLSPIGFV
jgi:hypothetical protein